MLIQLCATCSAPNLGDLGHLHDQGLSQGAHTIGFGQRRARIEHHAQNQRALIEGWQERSREEGNAGQCNHDCSQGRSHQRLASWEGPSQQLFIPLLEASDDGAVPVINALHSRQEVGTQYRRHRHRHQHGCQNGDDVGDAQRREQAAFDAWQSK